MGAVLSCAATWFVWTGVLGREFLWWHGALLVVVAVSWVASLAGSKVLSGRLRRSLLDDLPLILNRVLLASVVVALGVVAASLDPDKGGVVLVAASAGAVVLSITRGAAYALLARRGSGANRRVLIIGAGVIGTRVARLLCKSYQPGVEVVGFLDKEPLEHTREEEAGLPVLGSSYDLDRVISEWSIDKVVIAFSTAPHRRMLEMIWECDRHGVDVSIVPRFFEATTIQSVVENVAGIPLTHLNRARVTQGYNARLKRAFDVVAAAAGLLVLSPVLLAIALAVKLDSPGPVIFAQERAGYDGTLFTMYKFRSMKVGAQTASNYTVFGDPRRTRIGKYLRALSLDELPQLFNVLKGDMSLVGPRPEVWDRSQELALTVYRYRHRYRVKSGITGWAQVNGLRGDTSIEERVVFDNHYIENWSLWLDIRIILLTLFRALVSEPERSSTSS